MDESIYFMSSCYLFTCKHKQQIIHATLWIHHVLNGMIGVLLILCCVMLVWFATSISTVFNHFNSSRFQQLSTIFGSNVAVHTIQFVEQPGSFTQPPLSHHLAKPLCNMAPQPGQTQLRRMQASKMRSEVLLGKLRMSRVVNALKESPSLLVATEQDFVQRQILEPIVTHSKAIRPPRTNHKPNESNTQMTPRQRPTTWSPSTAVFQSSLTYYSASPSAHFSSQSPPFLRPPTLKACKLGESAKSVILECKPS